MSQEGLINKKNDLENANADKDMEAEKLIERESHPLANATIGEYASFR